MESSRYQPLPLNDTPSPNLGGSGGNRKSISAGGDEPPYQFVTPELPPRGGQPEPAVVLPPPLPPPGNFPGGLFRGDQLTKPKKPPPVAAVVRPGGPANVQKPSPFESLMGPIRSIFSGVGRSEPPRGGPPQKGLPEPPKPPAEKPKLPSDFRR